MKIIEKKQNEKAKRINEAWMPAGEIGRKKRKNHQSQLAGEIWAYNAY